MLTLGWTGVYLFCLFITFYIGRKSATFATKKLPSNLIPLNTTEGKNLLFESEINKDHFLLSCYYLTQKNTTFCGISSIVMVLNSFSSLKNKPPKIGDFFCFTETNIFNEEVNKIKTSLKVSLIGTTLEDLKNILQIYQVKVQIVYGTEISLNEFREMILQHLKEIDAFVIVNYWRKTLGQEGLGHVSPISAYNQEEDRFLILDVARNKYAPFWVKTEQLWTATATTDIVSKQSRGLLLVKH